MSANFVEVQLIVFCRAEMLDVHFKQPSQMQSNIERLDPENKERDHRWVFHQDQAAILSTSSKLL